MFYKSYPGRILVSLDQLFNALAGGNEDITISARTGYGANKGNKYVKWYKILEFIIDTTFYPLDGPQHCLQSYEADKSEDYRVSQGKTIPTIICSLFILIGCIVMALIFWTIYGIIKVSRLRK